MFLSRRPTIRPHRTIVVGALAIVLAAPAQSQQATPINWWAEDSRRVAFLRAHGQAYRTSPAVIWAPKDSLDPAWLPQFADSLAAAVTALKSLMGWPYAWQRIGSRPTQCYFSPGRFVSHADGRDGVFISLARVRQRAAPFLHEAAHELIAPHAPFYPDEHGDSIAVERAEAAFPYWLIEGLPDYLRLQPVIRQTSRCRRSELPRWSNSSHASPRGRGAPLWIQQRGSRWKFCGRNGSPPSVRVRASGKTRAPMYFS
jgi:hypothetical protein